MPTNKQKKIKTGYSPKNFKKKLLSYQPQFSSAIKSVSGILSNHMQTASEMFDTNNKNKKKALKFDRITNDRFEKKMVGKTSEKKKIRKKAKQKNG